MITLKTCTGCKNDFPETTARLDSITDAMVPAALALHRGGFTYEQIADDLGVTKDAVVSLFADQMRAA